MGTNRKDIIGQKFNRLLAVKPLRSNEKRNVIWQFICDCGNQHEAVASSVITGNTKSCGCLKSERTSELFTKHGLSKTPETRKVLSIWQDIHRKCYNKNATEYCRYGAKGRTIQESWFDDPSEFSKYVFSLQGFSMEKSLDRIDNTKGYIEGNLRWATAKEQARNRGAYNTNTSGVTGVRIRVVNGNTYTTAIWHGLSGGKLSKNFSVNKLGLLPAFAKACAYREEKIKELNEQGAGYSDKHGK